MKNSEIRSSTRHTREYVRTQKYILYIYTYNIHTYIHTYIHTFTHTLIHTFINTHTYTHVHNIHTYIHTYTHTFIHTFINTHTYTHVHNIHTHIHTYIYTYIHTYMTCDKAAITKQYFPTVQDRLKTKINLTQNLAAMLTGHGRTRAYLHRFKLLDDATRICGQGD